MWGHEWFNIALPTEVSETWGSLGGDAACVTATDATALSFVRPPARDVSSFSLVLQHPMSVRLVQLTVATHCTSNSSSKTIYRGDNQRVKSIDNNSGMWASHSFLLMPPTTCHT